MASGLSSPGVAARRAGEPITVVAAAPLHWKVGASTEIYGVTVGIYGTGTNVQQQYYTNGFGKDISKNQFVGYVQKTF